jgi:hypothetical protein
MDLLGMSLRFELDRLFSFRTNWSVHRCATLTSHWYKTSGRPRIDVLSVTPKAGVDSSDNAFQFFRVPDTRVYTIVQNRNCHAH